MGARIVMAVTLAVLMAGAGTARAGVLDPYIRGKGRYSCIAPRGFIECGPKPSNFAYAARLTYNVLDEFTRTIHQKTTWEKTKLVLAPLFAQVPVTQALASAAASSTKTELMESFLRAYFKSATHLAPAERQARQRMVFSLLDAYRAGKAASSQYNDLRGALGNVDFAKLMKMDRAEMKKAWDLRDKYEEMKKKLTTLAEKSGAAKRAILHAAPRVNAQLHYQQGLDSLSRCEFSQGRAALEKAKKLMMVYCQWAGYELRQIEKAKECYGTWYIDFLRNYNVPGHQPNYQEFTMRNLHNDLVALYEGLPRRLELLPEIDKALRSIPKLESRLSAAKNAIATQAPVFRQAMQRKDYRSACQAARLVLGHESGIPQNCALRKQGLAEKLRTRLNAAQFELERDIDRLIKRAEGRIKACRLQEAARDLQEAENKTAGLWNLEGGACRLSSRRGDALRLIGRLRDEIKTARATYCRPQAREAGIPDLNGTWQWFNGDQVRITRGGAHSLSRRWLQASVTPDPQRPGWFTFTWYEHGKKTWVDKLKLSPDKTRLSGSNQLGGGVSATKIGAKPGGTGGKGGHRDQTSQGRPKPSCEDCVRKYCPQCRALLFCNSNDPPCADCIARNKAVIDACQR